MDWRRFGETNLEGFYGDLFGIEKIGIVVR